MWQINDPGAPTALTTKPTGAPLAQLVDSSGNRQFATLLAINLTGSNQQAVTGSIPAQPVFIGKFFSIDLGDTPEEISSVVVSVTRINFLRRRSRLPVDGGCWQIGSKLYLVLPDFLEAGTLKVIYKEITRPRSGDLNKEFDISRLKNFSAQSIDSGGLVWKPAVVPALPVAQEFVQSGGKLAAYGSSMVKIPTNGVCTITGEATFALNTTQGIRVLGFDLSSMDGLWYVDSINRDGKIYVPPNKIESIGVGSLLYNRISQVVFLFG